ncbi:MAG: hypothetical protein U9Q22_07395 [Candidatus Altiarchaeota archaeon]|nr:hypothetical protein [Candidatus Altiarchaeota archaeon]
MEMEYWVLLDILSLCLLIICLHIIRDALKNIGKRVSNRSSPAILYLREKSFISGIKVLMLAMILWIIREILHFVNIFFDYDVKLAIGVSGILTAIVLSYGLYILAVSFRGESEVGVKKKGVG